MLILVTYGSRDDATEAIAERIARTLRTEGQEAHVRSITTVCDVDCYDAFVVGSRVHESRWAKEAVGFLRENRDILRNRPVWLFSSDPLGREAPHHQGGEPIAAPTAECLELNEIVKPAGHHVFAGALLRHDLDFAPAIEEWALRIANDLVAGA